MSHFSKVKTVIKDLSSLIEALKAMGYDESVIEQGDAIDIADYFHGHNTVQVAIRRENLKGKMGTYSDLGFKLQDDGTYELILDNYFRDAADAWVKQMNQEYAKAVIVKNIAWQGYQVESQETLADGSVRLVVAQW